MNASARFIIIRQIRSFKICQTISRRSSNIPLIHQPLFHIFISARKFISGATMHSPLVALKNSHGMASIYSCGGGGGQGVSLCCHSTIHQQRPIGAPLVPLGQVWFWILHSCNVVAPSHEVAGGGVGGHEQVSFPISSSSTS